ncbi:MAG: hypothetical protein ACK4FS_05800, partial [Flavobacterium sp.]
MKSLLQPYFIIITCMAASVYLFQITGVPIPPLVNNYFNDLLCLPIVLTICLAVIRILKEDKSLTLTNFEILSMFILYSVLFEIIFPRSHPRYTADIWDVI